MNRFITLLIGGLLLGACSTETKHDDRTTMPEPIGFENVTVGGELAERIGRNFDRMESELYQPAQVYWSEEESNGWPADKEGRTILALVLDARASGRQPVYLDSLVSMLPAHLNERGYMGTIHDVVDEQQLSGHGWLLRGLCEYFEWTGDSAAIDIASGIVNNLFLPIADAVDTYPIDPAQRVADAGDMSGTTQNTVDGWRLSSDIGCVFIGMDGLIHYYKHDRNPQIKELIDRLVNLFLKIDLTGIKAQTHATLTALRGLMRYSRIAGSDTLLPEVEKRWQLYKDHGMTENFENYNWFDRFDTWTEPCAIIDSYIVAVQLWQATRNPQYLADAEQIYYNGICVTQRANGGFGCDKPVGRTFDHISIHADEAHWCCTMRGGEGLARVAEYSCFAAADTLFVPFYHQNHLQDPRSGMTLAQESDYPFGNEVTFRVETPPTRHVVLALGTPAYMTVDSLTVNGAPLTGTEPDNGFIAIDRDLQPDDILRLHYSFTQQWTPTISDSTKVKATYGPLVLAAAPDSLSSAFSPLYHLLSPEVSIANGYSRRVIFPQTH